MSQTTVSTELVRRLVDVACTSARLAGWVRSRVQAGTYRARRERVWSGDYVLARRPHDPSAAAWGPRRRRGRERPRDSSWFVRTIENV